MPALKPATYCGQNLGAGKIDRILRGILLATGYTCIWCTLNIVTAYTIGDWRVGLVTGSKNPEVIYNATLYLKVDTLFYYVTAVICIVRNSMQGLGERIVPLISSSLEMIGKIVIGGGVAGVILFHGGDDEIHGALAQLDEQGVKGDVLDLKLGAHLGSDGLGH